MDLLLATLRPDCCCRRRGGGSTGGPGDPLERLHLGSDSPAAPGSNRLSSFARCGWTSGPRPVGEVNAAEATPCSADGSELSCLESQPLNPEAVQQRLRGSHDGCFSLLVHRLSRQQLCHSWRFSLVHCSARPAVFPVVFWWNLL